ncbi:MAG: hypothetical protein JSW51_09580 [Gemmatimonadota bacterium]|nr:MAG: hypothetical protein JSW51_09580 [Gemmatimonadota bacterium]
MKKGRTWAAIAAVAALVAILAYGSMATVQAECELCVQFNGLTECRRGSGADQEEAKQAAQKAACAVMAAGMAESVNCSRVPPTNVRCDR